jgi:hypothetical protein
MEERNEIIMEEPAAEDPEQVVSVFALANRDNSDFKWQRARNVVGVLEIVSEPVLKPRDPYIKRDFKGHEDMFKDALVAWEKEKLRAELITALEALPQETCCCGFFRDEEETKKELVKLLNDKWAKHANKKLIKQGYVMGGNHRMIDCISLSCLMISPLFYGRFKIDFFLWNWPNASGKAETNIILIRFYVLSSYGLRAASSRRGMVSAEPNGSMGSVGFSEQMNR